MMGIMDKIRDASGAGFPVDGVKRAKKAGAIDRYAHIAGEDVTRIRSGRSSDMRTQVLLDFLVLEEPGPAFNQLMQTYLLNSVAAEGLWLEELPVNMASPSPEATEQWVGELERGELS